jgi:hypothetical protein
MTAFGTVPVKHKASFCSIPQHPLEGVAHALNIEGDRSTNKSTVSNGLLLRLDAYAEEIL